MDDNRSLNDASIDQTLADLFAQAEAELSPNAELVQRVMARTQESDRSRRWVLLSAVVVGALLFAWSFSPAVLALRSAAGSWLPLDLMLGGSLIPLLLALSVLAYGWLALDDTSAA